MNWIWKTVIFIVIGLFLGFGVYRLNLQNKRLEAEVDDLSAELKVVEDENQELSNKIEFFKEPKNLLKELKSQFNYRKEDEEMIIVVPSTSSSSQE